MSSSSRTVPIAKALQFELVCLLCGVGLAFVAQNARGKERFVQAVALASLDSAIVAALPAADGSGGGDSARVLLLANRKRDAMIAADHGFKPWEFGYGGGIGLILGSLVSIGRLGLVRFTQRGALPHSPQTDA